MSRGAGRCIALTSSSEFSDIAVKLGVDVAVPLRVTVVDSILGNLRGRSVKAVHSVCNRAFEIVECDVAAAMLAPLFVALRGHDTRTALAFAVPAAAGLVGGAVAAYIRRRRKRETLGMAGNVGPAFGRLGPASNYGFLPAPVKGWHCFAMLAGRLEIYTMVLLAARAVASVARLFAKGK